MGAGTGVMGSEFGYQLTAGEDFNSIELLTTSAVGGLSGAVTGVLGQPGLNPVVSVGGKLVTQGISGTADYSLRSLINGNDITAKGVGESFVIGVGGGLVNEALPTSTKMMMGRRGYRIYNQQMEKNFVEAFRKPNNTVRQVMQSTIARAELWDGVDDIVRSGGITILQPWEG